MSLLESCSLHDADREVTFQNAKNFICRPIYGLTQETNFDRSAGEKEQCMAASSDRFDGLDCCNDCNWNAKYVAGDGQACY